MGRIAKKQPVLIEPNIDAGAIENAHQAMNELARMNSQANENAQAMAVELGYDGALSVGALEDEIRFYQRRTIEACLELGKRLVILKELTPHGEFGKRTELLGISERMARKFMAATLKFSNRNSSSVLQSAGTQTKLLELVVLDDGEIEALENGESARGLTLDKIETMSVSELKAALRDAEQKQSATEKILSEKNRKLDELAIKPKQSAATTEDWPDEIKGLNGEIATLGSVVDEALGKHLTLVDAIELLIDEENPESAKHQAAKSCIHRMGEQIDRICTLAAGLRSSYDLTLSGYIALDKMHVLEDQDAEAVAS